MQSRTFTFFSLLILLFCLSSCGSAPFKQLSLEHKGEVWELESPINKAIHTISLKLRLKPNSTLRLNLFSSSQPPFLAKPLYLNFSDENCKDGHNVYAVFQESSLGFRTIYFDKSIPWDTDIDLKISWNNYRKVNVSINQQEISHNIFNNFRYLKLDSKQNSFFIY